MKTFLLLCSLVVGSSFGEILSAKGMRKVGDVSFRPRALIGALGRMFRSPYLFGGVACLAVAFFSSISLLSYADLSFVAPLSAAGCRPRASSPTSGSPEPHWSCWAR